MTAGFGAPLAARWLDLEGTKFQLMEPLVFESSAGRVFEVPAGFACDLESRPGFVRLLGVASYALGDRMSTAAEAALHDMLYRWGPRLDPPVNRAGADALYHEAQRLTAVNRPLARLRDAALPWWRRALAAPGAGGRALVNWAGAGGSWLALRALGGAAWRSSRDQDPSTQED